MAGKSINELPEITSVSDSSLMALSSDGKTLGRVDARTFKNSVVGQHISNYVRYLNQDIKLDLNNGELTLKAGSKLYIPAGFESDGVTRKFNTVVLDEDMEAVIPDSIRNGAFLTYNINGRDEKHWSQWNAVDVYSGDTEPTASGNKVWYDTTNNLIKEMNDASTWTTLNTSFPFCKFSGTQTSVTSIDQVFNGFGYIGSTIFALPGTVVSMPNGKEENGVLKNTEVEITSVRTITLGSADTTDYICYLSPTGIDYLLATNYYESDVPPTDKSGYALWLNTQDNHFYMKDFDVTGSEWEQFNALGNICKFSTTSGKILKFESKNALTLVDTNTFKMVPHIVETYSSGTSWYRLWSDGWLEQGGRIKPTSTSVVTYPITFLKSYSDIPQAMVSCAMPDSNTSVFCGVQNVSTTSISVMINPTSSGAATNYWSWTTYGYAA